jgi:hypothetical protein
MMPSEARGTMSSNAHRTAPDHVQRYALNSLSSLNALAAVLQPSMRATYEYAVISRLTHTSRDASID